MNVPFGPPRKDLGGSLSTFFGRDLTRIPFSRLVVDVERARDKLVRAGIERRMLVGFLGENCYEWIVYDLAVMSLECVAVCFPVDEFAAHAPEELASTYDLSMLLVTAKARGRADQPWVIVMNDAGSSSGESASRTAVCAATDNGLRRRIQETDVCTVIFSSGTSGVLKPLLLSSAGVDVVVDSLANDWDLGPRDGILVALPLSIFQQRIIVYAALRKDTDILLTDSANLFRSFKALRPTIILGPPALFETVERRFDALPPLRRLALAALGRALAIVPSKWLRARLRRRLFRDAHDAFGGRIRVLITGSAPSRRSTLRLYKDAGLPLYQAYGLAEVGFIAWNRPGQNRPLSVGRPVVSGSVTITTEEEIVVTLQHPQAIGYFNIDPAEEARTFLPGGRIATGDLGRFDRDGYLHITGRKKNIILTQSGEKIQPEPIEGALALVPGVERAIVVGGGERAGLIAIVAIAPDATAEDETSIRSGIQTAVDDWNARSKPVSRVARFMLTRVAFRPETGLVTRNLKLDRRAVVRYFERELDGGS